MEQYSLLTKTSNGEIFNLKKQLEKVNQLITDGKLLIESESLIYEDFQEWSYKCILLLEFIDTVSQGKSEQKTNYSKRFSDAIKGDYRTEEQVLNLATKGLSVLNAIQFVLKE